MMLANLDVTSFSENIADAKEAGDFFKAAVD